MEESAEEVMGDRAHSSLYLYGSGGGHDLDGKAWSANRAML